MLAQHAIDRRAVEAQPLGNGDRAEPLRASAPGCRRSAGARCGLRPLYLPARLALAMPSFCLSSIRDRSNSAIAPRIDRIRRSIGVRVRPHRGQPLTDGEARPVGFERLVELALRAARRRPSPGRPRTWRSRSCPSPAPTRRPGRFGSFTTMARDGAEIGTSCKTSTGFRFMGRTKAMA